MRLADDVPVAVDWDGWKLRDIDAPKMLELCRELGLRTLANEVREGAVSAGPVQATLFPDDEAAFPFGANAPAERAGASPLRGGSGSAGRLAGVGRNRPDRRRAVVKDYHLVDTEEKFQGFYHALAKQKRFAFDLETTSLSPLQAEIVGLAFSWQPGEAWYLAVRGPDGSPLLDPDTTLERLKPIFEDPKIAKLNQNIKYDLLVLRGKGVEVRGVAGDPMVADYLLHAGERSHNLEELARRYLNHPVIPIDGPDRQEEQETAAAAHGSGARRARGHLLRRGRRRGLAAVRCPGSAS